MADEEKRQESEDWKPEEDNLDELDEQEGDEDLLTDGDDTGGSWETKAGHIPDIHLKRLDEVLIKGYPGDPNDKSRTGGIVCPKTLDLAWRMIKRTGRKAKGKSWTKARIQRASTYHGLRIMFNDKDVKAIDKLYGKLMKISQLLDDEELSNALSERTTYKFRDPYPKTTSMGALKFLEGAIADLADCIGIAKSNMYPILSIVSVVTHEPPMWPVAMEKEYKAIRTALRDRLNKLERQQERIESEQNKQKDEKTNKQNN